MAATVRPIKAMGEPMRTASLPGTVVGELVEELVALVPIQWFSQGSSASSR